MFKSKEKIRKEFLEKRKNLSEFEVEELSKKFCQKFLKQSLNLENKIIAGYLPFGNEVNILPLLKILKEKYNCKICLPVLIEKEKPMIFREWDLDKKSLIESKLFSSVLEPYQNASELIPEIILVPAVVVDVYDNRIGRGGGCYDRTLAFLKQANSKIQTIAAVYDFQIVKEKLPVNEFDYKVMILL